MKANTLAVLAAAALTAGAIAATAARADAAREPTLEEIRAAAQKYTDVKVALSEGYMTDGSCETAEAMGLPASTGAMGVHYFRPDLLGVTAPPNPRVNGVGTHTDFLKPAILIYEPQKDGSMQLVAVENLVFEKAWKAAGHTAPPKFRGKSFDHMVDDPATPHDEAHMFEPHYDQHLWLFRENPAGVTAQFNPNVTCAHAPKKMAHKH